MLFTIFDVKHKNEKKVKNNNVNLGGWKNGQIEKKPKWQSGGWA
jgi:hypothetical protein